MGSAHPVALQSLIQRGQVFRGFIQQEETTDSVASTGYPALDKALGGGLSYGQLHEVQLPSVFAGESRLFRAALAQAEAAEQAVFWFNPPAQPHLAGLGQSQARHVVVAPLGTQELVWAVAQTLQEMSAGLLMVWAEQLPPQAVRTWQRCLQGELLALVFTNYMNPEARAYNTRLRLQFQQQQVRWQVIKRSGGWPCELAGEALQPW